MEKYDICITGAGVLGAAVSRALAKYDLRILWLEKSFDVATGITRGNTSIIHGGFDDAIGSVKGAYSPLGVGMVEALDRELHFGFHKSGSLVIGFQHDDYSKLEALLINGRENRVRGLELWEAGQLREHEPYVNPDAKYALFSRDSGVVVAPEFCIALAENALANGVELHLGEELLGLRTVGSSGYELVTEKGEYACKYFVNAAGWGAPRISEMLGSLDYELQAVKGQYLVFERSAGLMAKHVLFPLPDKIKGKGVTITPTVHGNLLIGPDAELVDDFSDLSTNLENLKYVFQQAQQLLQDLPSKKIIRSYAGMRPRFKGMQSSSRGEQFKSGDFLIRYEHNRCELLGISSPGITASLPIAEELSGKVASFWNEQGWRIREKGDFQWERKPYIGTQRDKEFVAGAELRWRVELELKDLECLVCRCEQVKSSVVQDVFMRNSTQFGAVCREPDFLKWRSRVTMGFCQGQFCRPRLQKLINSLSKENKVDEGPLNKEDSHILQTKTRVSGEELRRSL